MGVAVPAWRQRSYRPKEAYSDMRSRDVSVFKKCIVFFASRNILLTDGWFCATENIEKRRDKHTNLIAFSFFFFICLSVCLSLFLLFLLIHLSLSVTLASFSSLPVSLSLSHTLTHTYSSGSAWRFEKSVQEISYLTYFLPYPSKSSAWTA